MGWLEEDVSKRTHAGWEFLLQLNRITLINTMFRFEEYDAQHWINRIDETFPGGVQIFANQFKDVSQICLLLLGSHTPLEANIIDVEEPNSPPDAC